MSMLSVRSVAGPVLLASLLAPAALAEDKAEDKDRFLDVRAGVSLDPRRGSPSVEDPCADPRWCAGQMSRETTDVMRSPVLAGPDRPIEA